MQKQTAAEAEFSYHARTWGEGFFGVNDRGHAAVHTEPGESSAIDLFKIVQRAHSLGVPFPLTIRLPEILHTRVAHLGRAFRTAMEETNYAGEYSGVYPVKVNQIRHVVEGILNTPNTAFGLECGSKAELVVCLPYLSNPERLLICNGYKNDDMIALMLSYQQAGRNVIPVVEKHSEFTDILKCAQRLNSNPRLGIRVQLTSHGAGQWSETSGDDSKFGISMPDLLNFVERLEESSMYKTLGLLHFHLGSQINDIQALKMAVKEITRIYVNLYRRGHRITYLDVGGGLGVNYEAAPLGGGTRGVDYSIQEYANAIVYAIKEICEDEDVPEPSIITENGRALSAHHALLVVEAIESTSKPTTDLDFTPTAEDHEIIHRLHEMAVDMHPGNGQTHNLGRLLETYHDAIEERNNADTLFTYGYLKLKEKALAERLYWTVCTGINGRIHAAAPTHLPDELYELDEHLVDQVLCDFSIFQSLTDHWSIQQLFPIMPLHRLNEIPTQRSRLVDLTCDSFGTISRFISPDGPMRYLNLHPLHEGEPYFLGIFLTGAYQDSLSDHHNLLGQISEVHVLRDNTDPEGFTIAETIEASDVNSMLNRVQYHSDSHLDIVTQQIGEFVNSDVLSEKQANEVLQLYKGILDEHTYLGGIDG